MSRCNIDRRGCRTSRHSESAHRARRRTAARDAPTSLASASRRSPQIRCDRAPRIRQARWRRHGQARTPARRERSAPPTRASRQRQETRIPAATPARRGARRLAAALRARRHPAASLHPQTPVLQRLCCPSRRARFRNLSRRRKRALGRYARRWSRGRRNGTSRAPAATIEPAGGRNTQANCLASPERRESAIAAIARPRRSA